MRKTKRILQEEKNKEDNLLENELDSLNRIYKLDKSEFETVLYAINKFHPIWLLKKLKKIYGHKYNPSLAYEILAHLLKHRYVDAIINFNFDELLDQAIDDELKSDEYHKIISDGGVPSENIFNKETGLRYPLYIKPHGTISHPSTLRFTEEAYHGLPMGISKTLKELISAKYMVNGKENTMKMIIIAVGFNMQSTEFNILLNENLPENSEMFVIKKGTEKIYVDHRVLRSEGKEKELSKFEKINNEKTKIIPVNDDNRLDSILLDLWKNTCNYFNEAFFSPRSIMRHELISSLFNDKKEAFSKK